MLRNPILALSLIMPMPRMRVLPVRIAMTPKTWFNTAASLRSDSIRLALFVCQLPMPVALQLQMFLKPLLCQFLQRLFESIRRIGPDVITGIVRIKQFGKYLAVMDTGVGVLIAADKLVVGIDSDMVLVAKERFTVLLRPAGVGIFLPQLLL
jgi:hypothetical protein